jgi:pilin isopeptide linkage protein
VVVQDTFTQGSQYIIKGYSSWWGNVTYQNTSISGVGGSFNPTNGKIELNDMAPGTSAVIKYSVQVSGDFFAADDWDTAIANTATATWYKSGKDEASSQQERGQSLGLQKSQATVGENTDKDSEYYGLTYLEYTVTVTAPADNKGAFPNVTVEDVMGIVNGNTTQASLDGISLVKGIEATKITKGSIAPNGNSFTWTIGDMAEGDEATLTYRAYIDTDLYKSQNSLVYSKDDSRGEVFNMTVRNTAVVKSDGNQYGKVSNDATLQKAWIKKTSEVIASGDHEGQRKFTIKVNSNQTVRASGTDSTIPLMATENTVTSLTDTLKGSGFAYTGDLEVKVNYPSGAKTYTFAMDKIVSTDANGYYTWTLDLTDTAQYGYNYGNISGPYCYEVSYYIESTGGSGMISNGAGAGFLNGLEFSSSWAGSGTGTLKYTKEYVGGFNTGYATWKTTFTFNMPAGAVYKDWLDTSYWKTFYWCDSKGRLTSYLQITLGDTVLSKCDCAVPGGEGCTHDYAIIGVDGTNNNEYEPGGAATTGVYLITGSGSSYKLGDSVNDGGTANCYKAKAFKVKFLKNIEGVSEENPLVITYESYINPGSYYARYDMAREGNWTNYSSLALAEDASPAATANASPKIYQAAPMIKTDISSDEDLAKGQLVWQMAVNNGSSIDNNAMIVDALPSGLTFDSLTVDYSQLGAKAKADVDAVVGAGATEEEKNQAAYDYFVESVTDLNTGGAVTDDTTYVKIMLKNLYQDPTATDKSVLSNGKVVLKLTTNMTEATKLNSTNMSGSGYVEFVNRAYIYKEFEFANGSGKKYILLDWNSDSSDRLLGDGRATAWLSLLDKNGTYNRTTWPYIKYTLDVNGSEIDLVDGADTVTIIDTMSADCRLAKQDELNLSFPDNTPTAFVVKDASGNVLTEGEDYTLEDETQAGDSHSFYLTVADSTELTVTYYVAVNGVEGQELTVSNKAHYDYYGYKESEGTGTSYSGALSLASAAAATDYSSDFMLLKLDQNGDPLNGATFDVYKVSLKDDGTPELDSDGLPKLTFVTTGTTGDKKDIGDGKAWFSHEILIDTDALYCVIETSAPDGYEMDTSRHYVEFTTHKEAKTYIQAYYKDDSYVGLTHGASITIENTLLKATATIPIKKDITLTTDNSSFTESKEEFTFTLVPDASNANATYLDEKCNTPMTDEGTTVTITGAGTDSLDLHFVDPGTYKFTVTENDLTTEETEVGYSKDETAHIVTVVVSEDATTGVLSATVKEGDKMLDETTPLTFTNTYTPEVILEGKKVLSGGRSKEVQEDEFTFSVYEKGVKVAIGKTLEGGEIEFTPIKYSAADKGTTHTYTILEDQGEDEHITYTEDAFFATATVGDDLSVTVTYPEDIEFTNEYQASGTLKLTGMKYVILRTQSVAAGEFSFNVTENGTYKTTVLTQAGGKLELELNYDQMDIGQEYTYVITENEGTDHSITYSKEAYTVTVKVMDGEDSDGTLAFDVTVTNSEGDEVGMNALNFVNQATYTPRSGINLDVLPYVIIAALAAGAGAILIARKRKQH